MAVKINGSRGLNFTIGADLSDLEEKVKKAQALILGLQKQTNAVAGKASADDSYRRGQVAIQKALGDSRVALQKLKEAQQEQRNEQEKSKAVIAAERAEIEKLKAVEAELSLQYKAGKIAAQEYALEQRKIADAQREATRLQREAERALKAQEKAQREIEKQTERNRKQLEKESSEYYKLTQALGKVRKEAKDVAAQMFRLQREGLSASDSYRQLEIRSKALTAQTQILDQGVKKIDASLGLHQRNVGNYGDALTNLSPLFASINQGLGNFGTSIDDLANRPDPFKALGTSLMAFGRASLAFLATPVGAIIALLGGLYALISSNKQTVIDFDSGLLGVSKTTGLAGEELEKFGDSVISLSNNLKSISSKKLLEYAQAAGTLGVKGSANLLRFTETLAKLETASDISGEEGAKAIARLLDITDGGVENVQAFGNSIVNLGNNLAASEDEILQNSTRIAQATTLYKLGHKEVLAYGAATRALGLQSEVVGSSFARTFGAIEASIRTGKNIETFAAVTGKSAQQLKDDFGKDAAGVFNSFIKGLNGVSKAGGSVQGVLASLNITSVEDQRVIATLAGKYEDLEEAMSLSRNAGTAMTDEFETANKKLENVGKRIGIAWDNLVLSIENGQGVFAKVGSYMGNELANTLVATKDLVDDVGVAWDVFGQYLDDFKPKAQQASQANVQYADSLQPIKDFFSTFTLRNFVFMFTVEIPNAFRTAGAYLDVFKANLQALARFISTASPEISKYIKDAFNPFAKADGSGIETLFDNLKKQFDGNSDFILDAVRRENEEYARVFAERYEDAQKAAEEGKKALADAEAKGVNAALAAEAEAKIAAAEAVSAATKNKATAAGEAAKRAEDAARRAAEEAKSASDETKEAADAAAQRAADAATQARQAADAAMENVKARRALQEKIDAINQEASRKQLSQNEAEIEAVRDKYRQIRKEVDAFYRDPKNSGLKVDTSGLSASEQREVDNVVAKQETEALKETLSEQRNIWQEFENYKSEYSEAMARERFKGEISEYESYVAYLKSLVPKDSDTSVKAVRMREMLEKEITKAEKVARDRSFDENLKNFKRIIDATVDSNTERLRIETQYFKDLATLEKNLSGEQNADKLAQHKAVLDRRREQEVEGLKEMAFQESAFYQKVMKDITYMTREEIKDRVKEIRKILKDPKLSPVERATAKQALGGAKSYLAETSKAADDAQEIEKYAQLASQSFSQMAGAVGGMNSGLGEVLGSLSQVAGIAGNAAGAFAGFASGNIAQGISGAVGAISGIISMFDKSAEKQAAAESKRQRSIEATQRAIDSMNRSLEQQAEIIDKALGNDKIVAFRRQMVLLSQDIQQTITKLNELNLTATRDGGRGTYELEVDLKNLNDILGAGGRPSRNGGSTQQGEVLKTIEEVLEANRGRIDELYKLIDAGEVYGDIEPLKQLLSYYDQLEDQLEDYKLQLQETVTGVSFDSMVDEIVAMFQEGKTAAEDFADTFQKLMENAIVQTFRRNAIEKQMQKFYDAFALAAEDGLSKEELEVLQEDYLAKMEEAKKQFEQLNQIAGTNIGADAPEANQDTLTGAIRAQLTEETGGKIAGIMQGQFGLMKQQLVNLEGIAGNMSGIFDIAKQNLYYQERIEQNTRLNAESSIRIEGKLDRVGDSLDKIAGSGSGTSARDMGYDG